MLNVCCCLEKLKYKEENLLHIEIETMKRWNDGMRANKC